MINLIIAFVRQLKLYCWKKILKKWREKSKKRKHCVHNASKNVVCLINNEWWCECFCQFFAIFHKNQLINEFVLFFVLKNNVKHWMSEMKKHVDLNMFKIKFVVVHEQNSIDAIKFISKLQKQIITFRNFNIFFSKNFLIDVQKMIDELTFKNN